MTFEENARRIGEQILNTAKAEVDKIHEEDFNPLAILAGHLSALLSLLETAPTDVPLPTSMELVSRAANLCLSQLLKVGQVLDNQTSEEIHTFRGDTRN